MGLLDIGKDRACFDLQTLECGFPASLRASETRLHRVRHFLRRAF